MIIYYHQVWEAKLVLEDDMAISSVMEFIEQDNRMITRCKGTGSGYMIAFL